MGMERDGPHPVVSAAASHSRHHQHRELVRLWSGATIEPFSRYSTRQRSSTAKSAAASTVFMAAVLTIYVKLIQAIEASVASRSRGHHRRICRNAADGFWFGGVLPASLHEQWTRL